MADRWIFLKGLAALPLAAVLAGGAQAQPQAAGRSLSAMLGNYPHSRALHIPKRFGVDELFNDLTATLAYSKREPQSTRRMMREAHEELRVLRLLGALRGSPS